MTGATLRSPKRFACGHSRRLPALALGLAALASCSRGTPEIAVTSETRAAAPPRVVALDPPNGAVGVDPERGSITVTFDREMDRQGWAWVIENPATAPETGESTFDASGRSNTVEVDLEPGRTYVVWVNSPEYPYFRDLAGVSAQPLRWSFSTRGEAATAGGAPVPIAGHSQGPPRVVSMSPPDGAVDVDAATSELRVTFDRAMDEGWSWVTEERESFPEAVGKAYMTPDWRTAVMPVRLEPGRTYVVWLNRGQYNYFRDRAGVELEPVRWSFSTAPAP